MNDDTVIDKLLLQAIASNKEKIEEYKIIIANYNTQVNILTKEISDYLEEYQKNCKHIEFIRESQYTEGGYDHVSTTTYTDKCVRCNKVIGSKLSRGTYA